MIRWLRTERIWGWAILRHIPHGTYPRPPTNSLWRNSFHSGVWGMRGVCSRGMLGFSPGARMTVHFKNTQVSSRKTFTCYCVCVFFWGGSYPFQISKDILLVHVLIQKISFPSILGQPRECRQPPGGSPILRIPQKVDSGKAANFSGTLNSGAVCSRRLVFFSNFHRWKKPPNTQTKTLKNTSF